MKVTAPQLVIIRKAAARTGLFAQEIGMPVKCRATAMALVRKGLAEWAPCQYPNDRISRLTQALNDIASSRPIPTPVEGWQFCRDIARDILSELSLEDARSPQESNDA